MVRPQCDRWGFYDSHSCFQVSMHDSTRSVQKKNEQLNASKRLIEEQEDEIMVRCFISVGLSYAPKSS